MRRIENFVKRISDDVLLEHSDSMSVRVVILLSYACCSSDFCPNFSPGSGLAMTAFLMFFILSFLVALSFSPSPATQAAVFRASLSLERCHRVVRQRDRSENVVMHIIGRR
jgi:hypothetical protein